MIEKLKNKEHYFHIGETIYGSLGSTKEWCGKKGSQGNIVYILMNNVKHADFDYMLNMYHCCTSADHTDTLRCVRMLPGTVVTVCGCKTPPSVCLSLSQRLTLQVAPNGKTTLRMLSVPTGRASQLQ